MASDILVGAEICADGASVSESHAEVLDWCDTSRRFHALIDGRSVVGHAHLRRADSAAEPSVVTIFADGGHVAVEISDTLTQATARAAAAAEASGGGTVQRAVLSPMPGKVVKVMVAPGGEVSAGEPLVVLEAMKMEHTLNAVADAVVTAVHASEGDVVPQRHKILSLEPKAAAA